MARTDVLSTNFSGGELSPRLYGRPDLAKYADSVKRARDVVIMQHGGATGRPGTDYLGEVKESSKFTRLIPFVYSADDAYVLEFGDTYMRVWKDGALVGGGSPYEITTPYATSTLESLDYTQGADTMFLALQTIAPYRLRRFADNNWAMDAAPLDPAPFAELGRMPAVTLTLSSAAVGSITATAGSSFFIEADVGRRITRFGGIAEITAYTSGTQVSATTTAAFSSASIASGAWRLLDSPKATCTPSTDVPVGATCTLVLDINGWRPDDVGSFVRLNGGIVKIESYADPLNVTGVIVSELRDAIAAPPDAWSLETSVWNATNGYPRTLTLHQQRLVAAGSAAYPQTIWGSKPGIYMDFTKGSLDDDSYSFELGSDEINPIRFLSSNRDLLALTYGGEWTLNGGIEKPITPTNIRAVPQAKVGCAAVRPEQIDDDLYYVQRGVSAVRTMGWNLQLGGYQSGEASTMSEHLARDGISAISYQQSPDRMAWLMRGDGSYLAMTASREQNVRAITLCTPAGGGVVESMATIPEDGEDRTYMVVRRTINGTTKRYVERMNWDAHQDCRVSKTPASATISGLSHLVGKSVSVVADGLDLGDFTVSAGGTVTLPRVAAVADVGLRYVPTIKLLSAETGTGMGASAGRSKLTGRCMVLFQDTVGCNVNGQPLAFRQLGEDALDNPVAPYTGWKDVSDFGWSVDSDEIEITQPQSYPITVLAVVRRITSNPG